jgi:hypothetical protein
MAAGLLFEARNGEGKAKSSGWCGRSAASHGLAILLREAKRRRLWCFPPIVNFALLRGILDD